MKGYQISLLPVIVALILIGALPIFGQEEIGELDEENNNIFRFENLVTQSEPLNDKINKEVGTVFISISEVAVPEKKEQYIEGIIQKIDKKCTTIVISTEKVDLDHFLSFAYDPVSFRLMQAVMEENEIRQLEDQDALQIYFHIPLRTVRDMESLKQIALVGFGLGVFGFGDGVLSGIIFESDLILNPIEFSYNGDSAIFNDSQIFAGMRYIKKFMSALEITFGYDFKLGLAVKSYKECEATFLNVSDEMLSLFDVILYKDYFPRFYSLESDFNGGPLSDLYSDGCRELFQGKKYYRVKQVL